MWVSIMHTLLCRAMLYWIFVQDLFVIVIHEAPFQTQCVTRSPKLATARYALVVELKLHSLLRHGDICT